MIDFDKFSIFSVMGKEAGKQNGVSESIRCLFNKEVTDSELQQYLSLVLHSTYLRILPSLNLLGLSSQPFRHYVSPSPSLRIVE